jgi:hypothetical protein
MPRGRATQAKGRPRTGFTDARVLLIAGSCAGPEGLAEPHAKPSCGRGRAVIAPRRSANGAAELLADSGLHDY